MTTPLIPGKIFFFQTCSEHEKSFVAATVTSGAVTGGGTINWPCAGFACSPNGGSIILEKRLFPPTPTENTGTADDNHGGRNEGVVQIQGSIGLQIKFDEAATGGVDINIIVYGSVSLDVFAGVAHASGTISGTIKLYGFTLVPSFGWKGISFTIEVRVTVRIGPAEFQVACSLSIGGSWKVSIQLGHFFGIGNCFQKEWFRRRHFCRDYPRRRNHLMNQWCWGPETWGTCGEYGDAPYPGCRKGDALGLNPMCLNDGLPRRRRRRRFLIGQGKRGTHPGAALSAPRPRPKKKRR